MVDRIGAVVVVENLRELLIRAELGVQSVVLDPQRGRSGIVPVQLRNRVRGVHEGTVDDTLLDDWNRHSASTPRAAWKCTVRTAAPAKSSILLHREERRQDRVRIDLV